jgi:hypothetical protein
VSIAPVPRLHGRHGDARFVGANDASGHRVLRAVIVVLGYEPAHRPGLPRRRSVGSGRAQQLRCPSLIDRVRIVSQRSKALRASHQALRSSARVRRRGRRESERTSRRKEGVRGCPPSPRLQRRCSEAPAGSEGTWCARRDSNAGPLAPEGRKGRCARSTHDDRFFSALAAVGDVGPLRELARGLNARKHR